MAHNITLCKTLLLLLSGFSHVLLFAAPCIAEDQAPLSMGFPRQDYLSELPFSPSEHLSDPGMEPISPALEGRFLTTELPGKPCC